jgi:energy-coupling factor transporter ATP-binding protein EcfA2
MEVVKLQIKNFLSISDMLVKPGQINQIVGANNQGKTTVIKAIEFAVKGSSDGSLVKFGEESAEVIVELADQTTIRRKLSSEGKQTVDVKKDGFKAPSPQAYLDALFEHSAFNPLDLLDPKRRNDAILASIEIKLDETRLRAELGVSDLPMPPLDYTVHGLKVIDQAHKYFYQRRAEANKDGGFTVDGTPVDNLSSSKVLRLAVGVARKLAKKTKLICIDGAEALDNQNFAALHQEIENDGFTYFITKVGSPFAGGPNDTVIPMENGNYVQ